VANDGRQTGVAQPKQGFWRDLRSDCEIFVEVTDAHVISWWSNSTTIY
jgi:hypothetical protein